MAQSVPGAVPARREPHHHLAYEDSTLRVLRVRVPAHDTTLLHEHDADYFWVALGASTVVNAKPGVPDATITSADLSVHYTPGKFAHVARNPGNVPFDNITVELLETQSNVRNLCETAMAREPLNCPSSPASAASTFSGATDHPVFATSDLQVSLVTIAPGSRLRAVAPARHVWVIAIDSTDANRTLMIEGGPQWVGGTFRTNGRARWALRNVSSDPVRVVTVVER